MIPAMRDCYWIIYSENHLDGKVFSDLGYRNLRERMTLYDLETHQAIELPIDSAFVVHHFIETLNNPSHEIKERIES